MRRKILASLLLLTLLLGGCSSGRSGKTVYIQGDFAYDSRETACTVGGVDIPQDLAEYFYRSHLEDVHNTRATESGYLLSQPVYAQSEEAEAMALTEQSLREYVAVHLLAGQYAISLSSDEMAALDGEKAEAEESYADRESYLAALSESHLSEEAYYNYLWHDAVEGKLFDYVSKAFSGVIDSTDAAVEENIRGHFYAAVQILITVSDECSREEALAKAQALLAEAEAADSVRFTEIALEQGDDGYGVRYFTEGYSYPFFEEAVKALREGETSAILESGFGYHIIRRVPMEQSYIDTHFESLRTDDIVRGYHELVSQSAASLLCEWQGKWQEINKA